MLAWYFRELRVRLKSYWIKNLKLFLGRNNAADNWEFLLDVESSQIRYGLRGAQLTERELFSSAVARSESPRSHRPKPVRPRCIFGRAETQQGMSPDSGFEHGSASGALYLIQNCTREPSYTERNYGPHHSGA